MAALIQYTRGEAGVRRLIDAPRFRIGRGPDNDLDIDDELVSKEHAVIELVQAADDDECFEFVIHDLGSTNGTFVNDERVDLHRLKDGDMLRFGALFFRFVEDEDAGLEETTQLRKTWLPGVYLTKKGKKR